MRYLILIAIFTMAYSSALTQSKKKVKEYSVKSKIEWQYEYRNGVETKFKESEYKFDDEGNMTMEKYYDENGIVIKHIEYSYDSNENLVAEITYNPKGQIIKKEEYRYKGELRIERKVYGPDGKLKFKKIYEYNQD